MGLTKAHIPAIAWTLFIATSCLLPASVFEDFTFDSLFELDKLIHLILFFTFFVLWALAINQRVKITFNEKIILLIISILYGIMIELIQSLTHHGRSYELGDVIANTIGSVIGVITIGILIKKLPLIKKHLPFLQKLY
ncbi:MAG: VanZ family protein [Bacteroidia bacterium]|nr:VanZ family protein [Bacteroidia bacterium]NNJ56246.1 VanZ family protein [Bacteroidia bacterium]